MIFSWSACLPSASCTPTPSVCPEHKCLCIGSVSCSPLTLAFSTCSDYFCFRFFSLANHVPLLFATTSLRSGAIQALFLHDKIECPKHFSDWESLMAIELCANCRKAPLTTRHDLSAPHCSAITNHSLPFLDSCYKKKRYFSLFFSSLSFFLFECWYLLNTLISCYWIWGIIPGKSVS